MASAIFNSTHPKWKTPQNTCVGDS